MDASAGVIVDVQNTLVNNALLRWTTEEQKKATSREWLRIYVVRTR